MFLRWLIALLVVVVGGLHVLAGEVATFKAPRVDTVPALSVAAPAVSVDVPLINGAVTDAQRFALAVSAGWSPSDALIATAISIAEDGSGNPTALSAPNFDNSRDFCLMQVNSGWWARFGGQQALADPVTCFRAGHTIYTIQGWCAWSTFGTPATCGVGHNNSYVAFLERARKAAGGLER